MTKNIIEPYKETKLYSIKYKLDVCLFRHLGLMQDQMMLVLELVLELVLVLEVVLVLELVLELELVLVLVLELELVLVLVLVVVVVVEVVLELVVFIHNSNMLPMLH
jgi:hypothetical protein